MYNSNTNLLMHNLNEQIADARFALDCARSMPYHKLRNTIIEKAQERVLALYTQRDQMASSRRR